MSDLRSVKVGDELVVRDVNELHGVPKEHRLAWAPPRVKVVRIARTYLYAVDMSTWVRMTKLSPDELRRRESAFSIETGRSRDNERRWVQTPWQYERGQSVIAAYAVLREAGVSLSQWADEDVLALAIFVKDLRGRS